MDSVLLTLQRGLELPGSHAGTGLELPGIQAVRLALQLLSPPEASRFPGHRRLGLNTGSLWCDPPCHQTFTLAAIKVTSCWQFEAAEPQAHKPELLCLAEVRLVSITQRKSTFPFIFLCFHHLLTGLHTWVRRRPRAAGL